MTDSKIIKYRKRKQLNIGILIFGIIFIYLLATIVMYITAPRTSVYEVRQGSILKDNAYTGLAVREEMVVYADNDGYLNYYAQDQSKVRKGSKIYLLSDQKLQFQEEASDSEITFTEEEVHSISLKIQAYNNQFDEMRFSSTYQLKSDLQNTLNNISSQDKSNFLDAVISNASEFDVSVKTTEKDGVLVYATDGLESLPLERLTTDYLQKTNYKKNEISNNHQIQAGDPVYKLVTSDTWYLLIEITDETKTALEEKTSIKVNFKKDNEQLRAKISYLENTEKLVICLTFSNSMIRYISDRYLDVELILEDESGLKIPKSAETSKQFYIVPNTYLTKGGNDSSDGVLRRRTDSTGNMITEFLRVTIYYEEDEMVYLDPEIFKENDVLVKPDSSETYTLQEQRALKGVFCINKGYAVFKQIKILCESDEYYIIEEGNSFGLSNYDHIALDSSDIKENDVVF